MDLAMRVRKLAEHEGLWQPGDTVIAAVSGGADSTALLHVLVRLAEPCGLTITAAHVNHGFRPSESAREAELVEALCRRLGVPLDIAAYDLPARLAEAGGNPQEEARALRYAFLHETAARRGASRIALAHHADDQAETVLMHLIRGSGAAGLTGMPLRRSEKNVELIRPFIRMYKTEILAYCQREGLDYAEDSSNRKTVYFRNRVRLELLPLLTAYNPRITEALVRQAEISAAEHDYLTRETEAAFAAAAVREKGGITLKHRDFAGLHLALQRRLIKLILNYLGVGNRTIPMERVEAVREAAADEAGSNAVIEIAGDIVFRREYDTLYWSSTGAAPHAAAGFAYEVPEGAGVLDVPEASGRFIFRHDERSDTDGLPVPEARHTAYFDAEELRLPLCVRSRKPGDRMAVMGLNGTKKVQDMFVDGKIAPARRERIPLVLDAEGVLLWVPGVRRSSIAPVSAHTRRVLRIEWQGLDGPE